MIAKKIVAVVAGIAILVGAGLSFYQQRKLPHAVGTVTGEPAMSSMKHFNFTLYDKPKAMAALVFTDGTGKRRTLDDLHGKFVLLNLWATWCPPCREEMPMLDRLQGKLGGLDFTVIALSIDAGDDGLSKVKRFFQEAGVKHLPIAIDSTGKAADLLGTVGLPTTLLIGHDGREIGRTIGPDNWDGPEAAALIRSRIERLIMPKNN